MYEESAQLTAEWAREMAIADEQLSPALSLSPDRPGGADERAHKQIAEIDAGITEIDQRLKVASRHIFALARPDPLSIEDWIQLLHPDEALVLVLTGHGEETFVWAFMRDVAPDSRWRGTAPRSARPIRWKVFLPRSSAPTSVPNALPLAAGGIE